MIIEFRNVTKAGNNVHCGIFFDSIFVATLNCTPLEFDNLKKMLRYAAEFEPHSLDSVIVET